MVFLPIEIIPKTAFTVKSSNQSFGMYIVSLIIGNIVGLNMLKQQNGEFASVNS